MKGLSSENIHNKLRQTVLLRCSSKHTVFQGGLNQFHPEQWVCPHVRAVIKVFTKKSVTPSTVHWIG